MCETINYTSIRNIGVLSPGQRQQWIESGKCEIYADGKICVYPPIDGLHPLGTPIPLIFINLLRTIINGGHGVIFCEHCGSLIQAIIMIRKYLETNENDFASITELKNKNEKLEFVLQEYEQKNINLEQLITNIKSQYEKEKIETEKQSEMDKIETEKQSEMDKIETERCFNELRNKECEERDKVIINLKEQIKIIRLEHNDEIKELRDKINRLQNELNKKNIETKKISYELSDIKELYEKLQEELITY